jgi:hypothetical protein
MLVRVGYVNLPAWSTLGFGSGEALYGGETVEFAGDHRTMREIAHEVAAATGEALDLPIVDLDDFQVLSVRTPSDV